MKSLFGSTASATTCGAPSTTKARWLEAFVTKRRDRRAALTFLKRTMKRYGRPGSIGTDRLPSYRAAMQAL